jgi:hypothetical protein
MIERLWLVQATLRACLKCDGSFRSVEDIATDGERWAGPFGVWLAKRAGLLEVETNPIGGGTMCQITALGRRAVRAHVLSASGVSDVLASKSA